MDRVNVAEAKAHLSELVAQAEAGETIQISRRGKPVVQLSTIARRPKPITLEALRAVTGVRTMGDGSAEDVIRHLRDKARY
jgi:prevent-host-death family protein